MLPGQHGCKLAKHCKIKKGQAVLPNPLEYGAPGRIRIADPLVRSPYPQNGRIIYQLVTSVTHNQRAYKCLWMLGKSRKSHAANLFLILLKRLHSAGTDGGGLLKLILGRGIWMSAPDSGADIKSRTTLLARLAQANP